HDAKHEAREDLKEQRGVERLPRCRCRCGGDGGHGYAPPHGDRVSGATTVPVAKGLATNSPPKSGDLGLFRPQRPAIEDAEARWGVVLAKQRDGVDGELVEADGREAIPQHREHALALRQFDPPGERHVEAKLLHYVRVAPTVEIIALPF